MKNLIQAFLLITLVISSPDIVIAQEFQLDNSITTNRIRDIQVTADSTLWAVGDNGTLLKSVDYGEIWSSVDSPTAGTLLDAYFLDSNTGWVTGINGFISKTTDGGESWITQSVPSVSTTSLSAAYFLNADSGFVAGFNGTVLRTVNGGISWNTLTLSTPDNFNDIYIAQDSTIYVAGQNGNIRYSTDFGDTWQTANTNSTNTLNRVQMIDTLGYAVGGSGTLLKSVDNGRNWESLSSPSSNGIDGLFFADSLTGYISGDLGDFFRTEDGGSTWNQITLGSFNQSLLSITGLGPDVWVAGLGGAIYSKRQRRDLVVDLRFTGNAIDQSYFGNDASVTGAAFSTNRFDSVNTALSFDGVDDDLSIPYSFETDIKNYDNAAVSFWFKNDTAGSAVTQILLENTFSNDASGIRVTLTNDSALSISLLQRNAAYSVQSTVDVTDDWNMVTFSFENERLSLYYNGSLVDQDSTAIILQDLTENDNDIILGGTFSNQFFSGSIDDFRFYRNSLTSSEILNLYQNYKKPNRLVAAEGPNQVELSWSSEKIGRIRTYNIFRDGTLIDSVVVSSNTDTVYTDTGLIPGTEYSYYINSIDTLGFTSQNSDTVSAVPFKVGVTSLFPFNGNVTDIVGNTTILSSTGISPDSNRFAQNAQAIRLNGTTSSILVRDTTAVSIFENEFSISLWFNKDNIDSSNVLLTKGNPLAEPGVELSVIQDTLKFSISGDSLGSPSVLASSVPITPTDWNHLVVTRRDSTVRLYLNNAVVDSLVASDSLNNIDNLIIGADKSDQRNWAGSIDDLQLLNRSITSLQVDSIYTEDNWPIIRPTIVDIFPRAAAAGEVVQIYGTGFSNVTTGDLTIGEENGVVVTSATNNVITFTAPNYSDNLKSISVSINNQNISSPYKLQLLKDKTAEFNDAEPLLENITGVRNIELSDLNGDDFPDLILNAVGDLQVSWYPSNGDGTFGNRVALVDGLESYDVQTADLDNDGDLDIVVSIIDQQTNTIDDLVYWFENQGGTFSTQQSLPRNFNGVRELAIADFDNDGDEDIAIAEQGANQIVWYRNDRIINTSGVAVRQFNKSTVIPLTGPVHIRTKDLDADGSMDLIASGTDSLVWFPNDGEGNFLQKNLLRDGAGVGGEIAIDDIDNDGDFDILSRGRVQGQTENVSLLTNDGSGNFSSSDLITDINNPEDYAFADVNGDGSPDIIIGSLQAGEIAYYTNNGSGGLNNKQILSATLTSAYPVKGSDIDSDGDIDIVAFDSTNNRLLTFTNGVGPVITDIYPTTVIEGQELEIFGANFDGDNTERVTIGGNLATLRNSSANKLTVEVPADLSGLNDIEVTTINGSFLFKSSVFNPVNRELSFNTPDTIRAITNITRLYPTDINMDGNKDIVYTQGLGDLQYQLSNGNGTFQAAVMVNNNSNHIDIASADLDKDGDKDLISIQNTALVIYYNPLNDSTTFTQSVVDNTLSSLTQVTTSDINRDGLVDILAVSTSSTNTGGIYVYTNQGKGVFSTPVFIRLDQARHINLADLDGDTDPELVVSREGNSLAPVYYENINGTFTNEQSLSVSNNDTRGITLIDIDRDSDVDIIFEAAGTTNELLLSRNSGGGIFASAENLGSLESASDFDKLEYIDINGDGNLDLFQTHNSSYLLNDGSETFTVQATQQTLNNITSSTMIDIDGDGDLDQVVADSQSGIFSISNQIDVNIRRLSSTEALPGDTLKMQGRGFTEIGNSSMTVGGNEATILSRSFNEYQFVVPSVSTGPQTVVYSSDIGSDSLVSSLTILEPRSPSYLTAEIINRNHSGVEKNLAVDYDQDGDIDIVVISGTDGKLSWYSNLGDGTFSSENPIIIDLVGISDVLFEDFDMDGRLDIATIQSGNIIVYRNTISGLIQSDLENRLEDFTDISTGDFDFDGDLDIIATYASATTGGIVIYDNIGGATFNGLTPENYEGARAVLVEDFDNDAKDDIAVISFDRDSLTVATQADGLLAGRFAVPTTIDGPIQIITADLNADGFKDIVLSSENDGAISWYSNTNGTGFQSEATINQAVASSTIFISTSDIDGDGDIDIVSGDNSGNSFWYSNNGSGSFSDANIISRLTPIKSLLPADINSDGDIDLLGSTTNDELIVFKNELKVVLSSVSEQFAYPGDSLLVSGRNFTTATENTVNIGDQTVIPTQVTSDSFIFEVPQLTGGLYPITISNDNGIDTLTSAVNVIQESVGFYQDPDIIFTGFSQAKTILNVDLDGDGDLDILTTSPGSNEIEWLVNNGSGQYPGTANSILTNVDAVAIAAVDLNSDGHKDIIYSNSISPGIYVLLNYGDTNFSAPITLVDGYYATQLLVSKINNDQIYDLIAVDEQNTKLSLFTGLEGGSFSNEEIITDLTAPDEVAIGDLDGDGDNDIVTISNGDNSIGWYRNESGASFSSFNSIDEQLTNLEGLNLADGDTDGDLDVLVSHEITEGVSTNNQLVTYTNTGNGTFNPSERIFKPSNNTTAQLVGEFIDVDGDKDPDVVGYLRYDSFRQVKFFLIRNDNGVYDTSPSYFATFFSTGTSEIIDDFLFNDLDSDGDLDLTLLSNSLSSANRIRAFRNEYDIDLNMIEPSHFIPGDTARVYGSGFLSNLTVNMSIGTTIIAPEIVSDKLIKLTIPQNINPGLYSLSVSAEDKRDTLYSAVTVLPRSDASFSDGKRIGNSITDLRDIDYADIDNDGDLDILTVSCAGNEINWFENNGIGAFSASNSINSGTASCPVQISTADLNNDGNLDVLYSSFSGYYVGLNQGDGTFNSNRIRNLSNTAPTDMSAADFDQDGDLDLILTIESANLIERYINNGDGSFIAGPLLKSSSQPFGSKVIDLDKDGDIDVVHSEAGLSDLSWSSNEEELFTPGEIDGSISNVRGFDLADINRDGNIDIAAVSTTISVTGEPIEVYINDGSEVFTNRVIEANVSRANDSRDLKLSDLNGDGYPDILYPSRSGNRVSVLFNDGLGDFTQPAIDIDTQALGAIAVESADLDGDGDLDIFAAIPDSNAVVWYENLTSRPRNLISSLRSDSVLLSWERPDSGATGFNLYRSTQTFTNISDATRLNTAAIDTNVYIDTTLTENATYFYRVTSINEEGADSDPSNITSERYSINLLDGFSTLSGLPGDTVRIFGSNLADAIDQVRVQFVGSFGIDATIVAVGQQFIDFIVPDIAVGSYSMIVTSEGITIDPVESFSIQGGESGFFLDGLAIASDAINPGNQSLLLDIDRDDDKDLVVLGSGADSYIGISDNDQNVFSTIRTLSTGVFAGQAEEGSDFRFSTSDLNEDSYQDIIFSAPLNNGLFVIPSTGPGTFGSSVSILSGINKPKSLKTTDLDRDGDSDVLVIDTESSTILWARNDIDFDFSTVDTVVSYNSADVISAIEVVDLNSDGYPDIVASDNANNQVISFINQQNGTFSGVENLQALNSPGLLKVLDTDKNGRQDLLIQSQADSSITVLFDVSSVANDTMRIGLSSLSDFNIIDSNNDGTTEIVYQDSDLNIRLVPFNRDTVFASTVLTNSTSAISHFNVGDFDSDGDQDIIVSNIIGFTLYENFNTPPQAPSNLSINRELGSLNLSWVSGEEDDLSNFRVYRSKSQLTGYESIASLETTVTTYADNNVFNGVDYYYYVTSNDNAGNEVASDTVTATGFRPRITSVSSDRLIQGQDLVIRGVGFDENSSVTFGNTPSPIVNADTNKIVARIPLLNQTSVSLNVSTQGIVYNLPYSLNYFDQSDGTFSAPISISVAGSRGRLAHLDVQNDGFDELILSDITNSFSRISYLTNDGSGGFSTNSTTLNSLVSGSQELLLADIVLDESPSLVTYSGNTLSLLRRSTSSGGFTVTQENSLLDGAEDIVSADIDDDGRNDLIVAYPASGRIIYYPNNNDPDLNDVNFTSGLALTEFASDVRALDVVDFNKDGFVDILSTERSTGIIRLIQGPVQTLNVRELTTNLTGLNSALIVDVNNDGSNDLVYSATNGISVRTNTGSGTLNTVNLIHSGNTGTIIAADIDADSDADLIFESIDTGDVSLLRNNGDGTFDSAEILLNNETGVTYSDIILFDVDNDRDLDLMAWNSNSQIQLIYNLVIIPVRFSGTKTASPGLLSSTGPNRGIEFIVDQSTDQVDVSLITELLTTITASDGNTAYSDFEVSNTDTSLVIVFNDLFAKDTVTVTLDSESMYDNSLGEYFIDSNNDGNFDLDADNFTVSDIVVANPADFDISGALDMDDLMLFRTGWLSDGELFEYELAPLQVKPGFGFPRVRVNGNNKYDIEDLITFIRLWNFDQETSSTATQMTKIDAVETVDIEKRADVLTELASTSDLFNTANGAELTYSFDIQSSEIYDGVQLKLYYDKEHIEITDVYNSSLFENVKNGQSVFMHHNDTTNGILTLQVANFGESELLQEAELAQVTFRSDATTKLDIQILSDFRFKDMGSVPAISAKTAKLEFDQVIPETFELFQNYPNPFNPTTNIQYSIVDDGLVSLTVYNILGQKVATLVDGQQKAGRYRVRWDARALASGVYLYQLRSGNNVYTKKMMLIK